MKQLMILLTLVITAAMLISGVFFPDSPLMWLGSTAPEYAGLRGGIIAMLIVLLCTKPPRALWLRSLLLAVAVALAGASLVQAMNYQLQLFDAALFIEVAIILAIEALEGHHRPARSLARKITVEYR
ncbi:hypothetical protein JNJ66_07585 [Candidatus Saccharibacteria bacterium]|nr:hypothetical protein [Candidatus Saccharibacteria bacterium]